MTSYFFINFLKNKLVKKISKNGGRNFLGRICIRGVGGGKRKNYRFLDLYRRLNMKCLLYKKIKDPFRNTKVGIFMYSNGLSSLMLLQKDLKLYSFIYSGTFYKFKNEPIKNGFSLPIKYMPLFTTLSNIETKPFEGGLISRSANTGSLLISKDSFYGFFKLNSG
jgi:large subunit ribosomal protein L2